MNEYEKARELGAETCSGINWTWANGFPTHEAAVEFNRFCVSQGGETRGVYDPRPNMQREGWSVRFR